MRNRALHDALRDFALEAAALLVRVNEDDQEVGFSLEEHTGGSGTLYRYRPLTREFIAERWDRLRTLPAFEPAARALGTGARAYLRRRGEPGADAEPALRAMLERLYEDSTSFAFPEERFERVYAGVERALYAGLMRATVAAPVSGVRLEGARIELADDVMLADRAVLTPAPPLPWIEDEEGGQWASSDVWVVLERDVAADAPLPLTEARLRFATALSALRLLDEGAAALGPLGFARAGDGEWQAFRLDARGDPRGPELVLASDEGWELHRLFEALEERRGPGPESWALERFETGLARASEVEALSDHLLALRALLGRSGVDPATIGLRLAALRADEPDRRAVQRRVEAAFALEPFVIEGGVGAARGQRYVEMVGRHGPQALVRELANHLRGLLAGVVRGELDADLAAAGDEQLLRSAEPMEIRAERLEERKAEEARTEAYDDEERPEPDAPVVAFRPRGSRSGAGPQSPTDRERWPEARADDDAPAPFALPVDEDAESYSAPV